MTVRSSLLPLFALLLIVRGQEASEEQPKDKGQAGEDGKNSRKELAEGKSYCEYDNCYELLGVKTDAGPIPIKRAYRRLAAEWHPDRCPGGDFAKCKELFPKYANAYEILSSSEMRKNYDYVLSNPYEFPSFYMKYSRPTYAPKSDLRFVFALTVLALAGVQYVLKHSIYEQALTSVKKDPRSRYNERLKEIMGKQNASSPKKPTSGGRGETGTSTKNNKATIKAEEVEKRKKAAEDELAAELAAELPPPPSMADNVAVSVFKAPLTMTYSFLWVLGGGMREPGYMTRRALGLSASEWEAMGEEEQSEFLAQELWVSENLSAYEEALVEADKGRVKSGKEKREERLRKKAKRDPSSAPIED